MWKEVLGWFRVPLPHLKNYPPLWVQPSPLYHFRGATQMVGRVQPLAVELLRVEVQRIDGCSIQTCSRYGRVAL